MQYKDKNIFTLKKKSFDIKRKALTRESINLSLLRLLTVSAILFFLHFLLVEIKIFQMMYHKMHLIHFQFLPKFDFKIKSREALHGIGRMYLSIYQFFVFMYLFFFFFFLWLGFFS